MCMQTVAKISKIVYFGKHIYLEALLTDDNYKSDSDDNLEQLPAISTTSAR